MSNPSHLKEQLLSQCEKIIQEKIEMLQQQLNSIRDSRNNETKSSAGDKFETGRAMMQIEEDKVGRQLQQSFELLAILKNLPLEKSDFIRPGSMVFTDSRKFFLGVALGKIEFEEQVYFCISIQSPIGKILMGKKVGDRFEFNKNKEQILDIL